jgi:hypothetical protein
MQTRTYFVMIVQAGPQLVSSGSVPRAVIAFSAAIDAWIQHPLEAR